MTASLTSKVAIVGLGYAGLPLAMAFSKVLQTIGFDIDQNRIAELKNGLDRNGEMAMDGTWFDGLTMGGKSDRSS